MLNVQQKGTRFHINTAPYQGRPVVGACIAYVPLVHESHHMALAVVRNCYQGKLAEPAPRGGETVAEPTQGK